MSIGAHIRKSMRQPISTVAVVKYSLTTQSLGISSKSAADDTA